MAKTNPLIPTVDIQQQEPTGEQLITLATVEGTPPAGASYAGIFALECILQDVDGGGVYQMTGTVAVPAWAAMLSTPVSSDDVDPALIQTVSIDLTAAEIIALYTTSIEVVPAIAGKSIILDSVVLDLTGTATQFTGGGVVNLQYDDTVNGAGLKVHADIAASVITGATARTQTLRIPLNLTSIATAAITGLGLYIGAQTAVFAAGTGTAKVIVNYHTI